MSSVGINLSLKTRMSATPQMQQALKLLQLSTADFVQEMQQALTSNPFLEEIEEEIGETDDSMDESAELEESVDPIDAIEEEIFDPFKDVADSDPAERLATEEPARDPFEQESPFSTTSKGVSGTDACDWIRAGTSLRTHLLDQICGCGVGERLQMAATLIVESLDDDGYLRTDDEGSFDSLRESLGLTEEEVEEALSFVQRCDPTGVGARDLRECLLLQLQAMNDDEPAKALAIGIVSDHLDLMAQHRYASMRTQLSCDDAELNEACSLIRRLDPQPGHQFSDKGPEYVIPDVIVKQQGNELVTLINQAAWPQARLNSCYVQWFKGAKDRGHPALSQHLQEARWLMHNVEHRFTTIKRVAEAIVKRQRKFFECGDIALEPMILKEVADDLGIHESTVSRATGNKYMQTPRGTFEFRYFFSRSLPTETGGSCSATAVRALITDMIAREKNSRPLSDVALANLLSQNGVRVARRTVTKYRNLMKVAPVEMRRRA